MACNYLFVCFCGALIYLVSPRLYAGEERNFTGLEGISPSSQMAMSMSCWQNPQVFNFSGTFSSGLGLF